MKREDVKRFLEGFIEDNVPIYPSSFPQGINTCYSFEFDGNSSLQGDVAETHLTIYSRAEHPSEAEELTVKLMEQIQGLTDFYIGDTHVILVRSAGKVAEYGGKDETGVHYFLARYRLLID